MVRSMRRSKSNSSSDDTFITPQVVELLNVLDIASVLLSPGETPVYYSPSALTLGVIRDDKLVGDELHALIRSVRRSGKSQEGTIEIPLGPIGEGTRKLAVKVNQLSEHGLTIAFFSDESEAERIDAVRRDFVANISHELKTPISALRTLSDAVSVAATDPHGAATAPPRHSGSSGRPDGGTVPPRSAPPGP